MKHFHFSSFLLILHVSIQTLSYDVNDPTKEKAAKSEFGPSVDGSPKIYPIRIGKTVEGRGPPGKGRHIRWTAEELVAGIAAGEFSRYNPPVMLVCVFTPPVAYKRLRGKPGGKRQRACFAKDEMNL